MLQQISKENFGQMLSQFSTAELENMVEKFPYFQQAHVLLAKKYQLEHNPRFDQQLQLAALYIQDRELLYSLFNDKSTSAPLPPQTEIKKEEEPALEFKPGQYPVTETVIDEPVHTEIIAVSVQPLSASVNLPGDIEQALEDIKQSAELIQQLSEQHKPAIEEAAIINQQVFENSPVTEVPAEEKTEEPEQAAAEQIDRIEAPAEELEPVLEKVTVSAEPAEKAEPAEDSGEVFSKIEPHTFDEWLAAFNNKKPILKNEDEPVEDETADKELNQLYAQNITADYLHNIVKEETNYAKGLERFIEQQIQKHKLPETKKKVNEQDIDPELITETMAKVYEMQKKYTKAINAYQALTLKFPEKSSLFAARINFLKNIV